MKKYLFSILFLGGIFFSIPVFAGDQQLVDTYSDALSGSAVSSANQNWISNSGMSTNQITSIQIKFKSDNTCNYKLRMTNTSLATSDATLVMTAGDTSVKTFTYTPSASFRENNISKINLSAGSPAQGGCTLTADHSGTFYGINTTSTYPNGSFTGGTNVKNLFFTLNGGQTTIDFTTTPTSTCQFNNWAVTSHITTSDLATCHASGSCSSGVANAVGGSNWYLWNQNSQYLTEISDESYWIPKKNQLAPGVLNSAIAYICSKNTSEECDITDPVDNANIIAYSPTWEFIFNGLDTCSTTWFAQSEEVPLFTVTGTSAWESKLQANCDAYSDGSVLGGIVWGICTVISRSFVPSEESINQYDGLKTLIQNKPPFGYFTAYKNGFDDMMNNRGATSTISQATTDLPVSVIMNNFTILQKIKTLVGWFLWLILPFYFYERFKNFSLHG